MAPSSFILITLFSLAIVAGIADARMVPGQYNIWQSISKDEAVVEAIEHLMHGEPTFLSNKKNDCDTSNNNPNEKAFVRDFEPRPNISSYPDDAKLKGDQTTFLKDEEDGAVKTNKEFMNDFEPRPNVSVYQG